MRPLTLYSRPDCHLCDEAESLLISSGQGESYQKTDIETDLKLLRRYRIHVPVLMRNDIRKELFWPFDAAELAAFLGD